MALSASEHLSGGYVRDPDERLVIVGATGGTGSSTATVPAGATPVNASSANQANANAVATLPAAAGKTTYISGFQLTASGATAGLAVTATVAGVLGGTLNYTFTFPAGALVPAQPLVVTFPEPLPSSAVNTAIVVTLPASGAGGTNATAAAQGFQL
jgi:hypothetical protein